MNPLTRLSVLTVVAAGLQLALGVEADDQADPWATPPVVREIVLERGEIFSQEDRDRLPWLPLGLVNRLHITTRPNVIRRELLFEEGDRVRAEALDESERKLRSTGFFGEAHVLAVWVARDSIDVVVQTREVWTTEASAGYERFEDQIAWWIRASEGNFLGSAKQLDLARSQNEDGTDTWSVSIFDRQLFDGLWRGGLGLSDSGDDGSSTSWSVYRPFQSVGARGGGGAWYSEVTQRPRFYLSGGAYIRPRRSALNVQVEALHRITSDVDGSWRFGPAVGIDESNFESEAGLVVYDRFGETETRVTMPEEIAEDREVQRIGVILERATSRYAKERFIYAMGVVEDIALGNEGRVQAGWASSAFGAKNSGLDAQLRHGWAHASGDMLWVARTSAGGLWKTDGSVSNFLATGSLAGYYRWLQSLQIAFSGLAGTGSNVDRHRVYTLGIDNGLRAAGFREFAGDRILRGNVEMRWVHEPGILGLFTPGLTAFADAGNAWFESERDLQWTDIRGAVGVGFRLGFMRGSQVVPVRIDLAWPVLYDNQRPGGILSIGSGQVF